MNRNSRAIWQLSWTAFTLVAGLALSYGGYLLMGQLLAPPLNIPVGIMVGFIAFIMFEYMMQLVSAPFTKIFGHSHEDISYFS